jgi:excinuclease ABC B subunit
MPLEVHSPYTPKGDQPQAIKSLVDGARDGLRFQTLRGATGTGKSVHYDEPVTILLEDGSHYRGSIGHLIDTALGDTQSEESFELPPPESWQVLAWNPKTGNTSYQKITGLSRHTSPEELYKIHSKCGREVTVTGDHSVWVLREGQLQLLPGSELKSGDALPIPLHIPEPTQPLESLNLLEVLRESKTIYADVRAVTIQQERGFVKNWLSDFYNDPLHKRFTIEKNIRGHGVSFAAATALLERTDAPLESVFLQGKTYKQNASLAITPELMTLWGTFLAEGHAAPRFALLSVREEIQLEITRCLSKLNIAFYRRKDGDFVIASRIWRDLFAKLMGQLAGSKALPECWTMLSNAHLAKLLQAYFEGDGGIDKGSVTSVTLSKKLATDLSEALLRFGIWARVREVQKKKPNGEYGTYYKITISGASNLTSYSKAIGFISSRKTKALETCLKNGNTNVDLLFGMGNRLKLERQHKGLTQQKLAELSGICKGMIRAIESGRRNPSRDNFRKICNALAIEDTALRGLANLHWSPITVTEKVKADKPFVYDFSVEGYETFFTGRGGLFVHNTYTVAKIIEELKRPALILAPNKVLTAQLAGEFREFFPTAAVEFFISYYDYYQPEAYVPAKDLFIEKDANINQELERLRHSTTRSLLTRKDVIVVASVSAIYGLGSPVEYQNLNLILNVGGKTTRDDILTRLITQQYERNDIELAPGRFRAKGDVVEIWAAYETAPLRIEMWGDEIDKLVMVDPVTGSELQTLESTTVFPAKHYVTPYEKMEPALQQIEHDLQERLEFFEASGKLLEKQRLKERTMYDLEMMRTLGYCSGIENYSRYLDGRQPGEPPNTLMDFFSDDFLVFMDESHVMVPQIRGMYNGDRARKQVLVDYGFRLPAALDNRPLKEDEFFQRVGQVMFVSATPAKQELEWSDNVAEQVIRPTGLIDPQITVKPSRGQIDDLLFAIRERADKKERVLVTTLTKKMAEDLTEYFAQQGTRVRYMHSDIDAIDRQVILRDLRLGHFDVLVGINLLREGLDLPEVSLVAILDADKTGFLRSERSLIQTIGRAARNVRGEVYLYADVVSDAMKAAIDETNRRRDKQVAYNAANNITPETIQKSIRNVIRGEGDETPSTTGMAPWEKELVMDDLKEELAQLEMEMWQASDSLDFEKAAAVRDRIREIEAKLQGKEVKMTVVPGKEPKKKKVGARA